MANHPQVRIEYNGQVADVDEGIAELILAMWKAGIETILSCQNNHGRVWVNLPAVDAERFLSIVAGICPEATPIGDEDPPEDYDMEGLYNRVAGEYEPEDWEEFRAERAWRYDCSADDLGVPGEPADVMISVSVRFPHADLPEVLARLREAS